MTQRKILLIIGGGIAAYKACELIRLIRKAGMSVRCVVTAGGQHFVTPMTLAALSEQPVHTSLWDLKDEAEMGHIQLSREADLVVVAPATADLMAKMAAGIADDLATTLLLATDKPVLAAPAMNVRMWQHAATRRNVAQLKADGIILLDPDEGPMACGEFGPGRLPEPSAIMAAIEAHFAGTVRAPAPTATGAGLSPLHGAEDLPGQPDFAPDTHRALYGRHIVVSAGPTREPIDPVRYIANRSSGQQGFAIAGALAALGARVTLVAGPVSLETPAGVERIDVETAREMAAAVDDALPADAAVMVAAVADWRAEAAAEHKIKKTGDAPPTLALTENPDILARVSAAGPRRPALVVGFAAETDNVLEHARAKLAKKGCDWIVANDVSGDVMGGTENAVHLVTADGVESWDRMPKGAVATRLAERIATALG
ncbi:bifunctional phosphopantothenoylcysteine decarboxylase/phosphopantothenate synthase [Sphingomonas sanxanigenens]|uniref:Coenzyme A biosynthesis bifunctional protein CoaBC n=1 Tax=Sphingomonas sanxanigenens DSM 19645 = NX02 TaxID=1123269 RepID=W0AI12_9SPHN|nr:bifunctional phosphopantothenoylcysteine decarboxylase/phosphopantothenate synthase [Sphingomonas sanxanigenens]AHE57509.1 hypothetical protein NX02_29745 [Sphingomonas sanxanigenens DSM 19645 = NX02]